MRSGGQQERGGFIQYAYEQGITADDTEASNQMIRDNCFAKIMKTIIIVGEDSK